MNTILVSVIVPVYNTKHYLEKCFDSLRNQSLQDIEIIVVDDGSTDGSSEVCNAYASEDPRFIVIHQENKGLSAARNRGLEEASGKYVMFVDSDDWVSFDFCRVPYLLAEKHDADIVVFRYQRIDKDGESVVYGPSDRVLGELNNIQALEYLNECTGYAWNKLYSLDKCFSGLKYPVGYYYEDQGTTHRAIYKAEKVYFSDQVLYNYLNRNNSIVTIVSKKIENDHFEMDLLQANDLDSWGLHTLAKEKKFITSYRYLCHMGTKDKFSSKASEILNDYDGSDNYFNARSKVMIKLFLFSKPLFNFACVITGRRIHFE